MLGEARKDAEVLAVVGLTGGIASGKSTVSKLLQNEHHIPLIDLDKLARVVVEPGTRTLRSLVRTFGDDILRPDGSLDRPALGKIVFDDDSSGEKRKKLNSITHRAIRRRMAWELFKFWMKGEQVAVVDTPLLIEVGMWRLFGEVIVVYCSPEDQLTRLLSRDTHLSESSAKSRLAAQQPLSTKLPYADVILDNRTTITEESTPTTSTNPLSSQVAALVRRWRRRQRGWWILSWIVPGWAIFSAASLLIGRWWTARRRRLGKGRPQESLVDVEEQICAKAITVEAHKDR